MAWWVQPGIALGVAFVVALLVRAVLLRWIGRRAEPRSFAAVLVDTVRLPSLLWAIAVALAVAVEFTAIPARTAEKVDAWIGAFVIISLTLVASAASVRAARNYGERQGMQFAGSGLSRALIRILYLAIGATFLLVHFQLWTKVTPLLTAFGVGGLAVALALQDTLANFFAGVHILVERPVFVGDAIKLEGGQEGVVTDIGWRTTRIRTGGNDIVVVPNTKITSGILVNWSLPERRTAAEVQIVVAHAADLEAVRGMALEEAARVEGVMETPAPVFLCDPGVLPTHTQCKLIIQVADHVSAGRIQSDLRMRLLARFRQEGVPLPEPRTL